MESGFYTPVYRRLPTHQALLPHMPENLLRLATFLFGSKNRQPNPTFILFLTKLSVSSLFAMQ